MKEWLKSIPVWLWILLSVAALILVWKFLIPFLSGLGTKADAYGEQLATGQKATLTSTQAQGLADSIYNSGNTLWTNDNSAIEADFGQIKNDADFHLVEGKFGNRTWGIFGIIMAGSGNMSAYIRAFFTPDEIGTLNGILTKNGVTAQV